MTLSAPTRGLQLRAAPVADVPLIVGLHREIYLADNGGGPPDGPRGWFAVGGPWMHESYCRRHLEAYRVLGWDVWVVVDADDKVVGHAEVLYTTEPEPFGRYAHLEILELAGEVEEEVVVEEWLLGVFEERAVSRGYDRFFCRPAGSGGRPPVLERLGYEQVWRSRHMRLRDLRECRPPGHRVEAMTGDYASEASGLVALNHREASEYRWRYLWRSVLTPGLSDFPTNVLLWAAQVTLDGGGSGVCLVSIQRWRDPRVATADLRVGPGALGDVGPIGGLIEVAAHRASSMGAETVDVYLPDFPTPRLRGGDVEHVPLEMGDPWLRKTLAS